MLTREEWIAQDLLGLVQLVEAGEIARKEVLQTAIREIEAQNPRINSVIYTRFEEALADLDAAPEGPRFLGMPYLIKDLYAPVRGMPLSNGSSRFKGMMMDFDSSLVARLRAAGFSFLGRTTSSEMGMSAETNTKAWGTTRNPWNTDHIVGGSSGGAGASVAAGMLPATHATDSAGSIRIPASFNGLVGLKPTRGLNPWGPHRGDPNGGISHEHAVSRTVRDTAALLDVTAGPDAGAPYFAPRPPKPFEILIQTPPERLRIGFVDTCLDGSPVDPACKAAVTKTAKQLEALGHAVEEAMPDFDVHALTDAMIRYLFGSLSGMFPGVAIGDIVDGLEPVTVATLAYANGIPLSDHVARAAVINREVRRLSAYWETYDILLTPATGTPPPKHGALPTDDPDLDLFMDRLFRLSPFTATFNASGQPAISLPVHATDDGLPVAVQLVGRYADDATVLKLAAQIENAMGWRPILL
ncbi:amidase [Chachezhania sediminis]|uniref:amidase n=1 Tax=Chachezhania sediminis TaxID=2599291 RepID=UPI00131B7D57|nr:amidase [Chachezhania sediminis]